jgi:Transglutaminase-like superfamily
MLDWMNYVGWSDDQLSQADVAVLNFCCARGLPGMEKYEAAHSIRLIDEMADKVASATQAYLPQFLNRPNEFENSLDYFRALVLVTVLQRNCGIRYDQAKIPDHVPYTPDDTFLHRVIHTKLGTCANIPVLYVAVGRRLSYPMKLVQANGREATHLFVRWDDPTGNRFNIEATDQGMRTPPDDYYRAGRYQLHPSLEEKGQFLRSKTPREELACFLAERFCCFRDARQYRLAIQAMGWACVLAPKNAFYLHTLKRVMNEWLFTLNDKKPKRFSGLANLAWAAPICRAVPGRTRTRHPRLGGDREHAGES